MSVIILYYFSVVIRGYESVFWIGLYYFSMVIRGYDCMFWVASVLTFPQLFL